MVYYLNLNLIINFLVHKIREIANATINAKKNLNDHTVNLKSTIKEKVETQPLPHIFVKKRDAFVEDGIR